MAESITEGTLTQFNRQVGDFTKQDEKLVTFETDKIDVSVNASHSGIIQQLLVAEGDSYCRSSYRRASTERDVFRRWSKRWCAR